MIIHVSKATQAEPIEWFLTAEPIKRGDAKLVEYLRNLGCSTVGDIFSKQGDIKRSYWEQCKVKLGYDALGVKVVKK